MGEGEGEPRWLGATHAAGSSPPRARVPCSPSSHPSPRPVLVRFWLLDAAAAPRRLGFEVAARGSIGESREGSGLVGTGLAVWVCGICLYLR
jgi:hypothetical protein